MFYLKKFSLLAILVLCLIFSACENKAESNTPSNTYATSEFSKVELNSKDHDSSGNNQSTSSASDLPLSKPSSEIAYSYHSNTRIDHLISVYNEIAEYPISPDMISDGAYDFSANISCNDVFIMITASDDNGFFIDYKIEAKDDSSIKPLFRDFCKSLNSDINDNDINSAWSALQTKEYKNYNNYKFKGIECTYTVSMQLSNGAYRFAVKANETSSN